MTDLEFIVLTLTLVALILTRAASSFGFAYLYSQDPNLQLEWYPESSVFVYLLLVVYCIISPCYVMYCNL